MVAIQENIQRRNYCGYMKKPFIGKVFHIIRIINKHLNFKLMPHINTESTCNGGTC